MELDPSKFAEAGPIGLLLGAFVWLLWKVGMRIVKALDRLIDKIDEHTATDVAHHAAVRHDLIQNHGDVMARLEGFEARIDTALDLTPVRHPRPKTSPHGVPTGYYPPRKPTVKDDD